MKHPTRHQLHLAGWLSITSAIITIPLFILAIIAVNAADHKNEIQLVSTLLLILNTGMSCYILLTFRDYLHHLHAFHRADRPIAIIVGITVFTAVLAVLSYMFGQIQMVASVIMFLSLLPQGIFNLQLGMRLFQLKDPLFGLRNALSYTLIVFGVCLTSLILFLPAILVGMALDIMLGIILVRSSELH